MELLLIPRLALIIRSYAPRVQWEKHLYDVEIFKGFKEVVQKIDTEYGLDVFKQLEKAGNEGKSLWEVRMEIYK
jgi:hypothetical protein